MPFFSLTNPFFSVVSCPVLSCHPFPFFVLSCSNPTLNMIGEQEQVSPERKQRPLVTSPCHPSRDYHLQAERRDPQVAQVVCRLGIHEERVLQASVPRHPEESIAFGWLLAYGYHSHDSHCVMVSVCW